VTPGTGVPTGYRIRAAVETDIPALQAVERDAAELFRTAGAWTETFAEVRSREEHALGILEDQSWVALDPAGAPCGFALGAIADGHLHLLEIGVARAHQGQGLGTALLRRVIDHARWRFDPVLTLTTDRDLPWNAPFYRRHGFVILKPDGLAPDLAAFLATDIANGLGAERRVAMAKVL
jgi:GNAT superfamily N-acetyltransferase